MIFTNNTGGDFLFNTTSAKRMRFGEFTSYTGLVANTGYIIIKDAAGTERKLLVIN